MNDFEKRKCLELTNKMLHKDLCRPFRNKVDPENDGAPDYYDVIKNPMDLTTVRKKLVAGEYKSIALWSEDVKLIFKNARSYNDEGSLIDLISQELEQWFARKMAQMPHNKEEEWMLSLRKYSSVLSRLSNHPPSSIVPMHNIVLDTKINQATASTPLESGTSQDAAAKESDKTEKEKADDAASVDETTNNDVSHDEKEKEDTAEKEPASAQPQDDDEAFNVDL